MSTKPEPLSTEEMRRFWSRVSRRESSDECWMWLGAPHRKVRGYGRIMIRGVKMFAHRLSFEMHYRTGAAGMQVLHSCDNTRVVLTRCTYSSEQTPTIWRTAIERPGKRLGLDAVPLSIRPRSYDLSGYRARAIGSWRIRQGLASRTFAA